MGKLTFKIQSKDSLRDVMQAVWDNVCKGIEAGPVIVELGRPKRSLDQNRKMWPMLTDISKQVKHHGMMFSPDDWKDICTAGFEEQVLVPGINGGFVAIGSKTSKWDKKKFSEFIEFLYWFGQEKEIRWSDKALDIYQEYSNISNGE